MCRKACASFFALSEYCRFVKRVKERITLTELMYYPLVFFGTSYIGRKFFKSFIFNNFIILNKSQKNLTSPKHHSMIDKISFVWHQFMIRLQGDLGETIYEIPLVPDKYRVGRR